MTHRPEHDAWSRELLLGEGSPAEMQARSSELASCEVCGPKFAQARKLVASLDRSGQEIRETAASLAPENDPELREMIGRFEKQALDAVQPSPAESAGRLLRFLKPALAIAAVVALGAIGLLFLANGEKPVVPDGGGPLGQEIVVQHPGGDSFSWNAAGCESFTVTIFDASGKQIFMQRDLRETKFRVNAALRLLMDPGASYQFQVEGVNPRPGQKNPVSGPLRFSAP